jgi:uncharacterized membrane protein YqhA
MITRILEKSRYLTFFVVLASLLSTLTLLVYVMIGTVENIIQFVESPTQVGPLLSLRFIKLVDVALLATVFQLIAVGIYRLFIQHDFESPTWMKVDDLDDLKNKLVRVIVLVLAVSFLTEVIEGEPGQEVAFLGVGVASVIASLTYFSSKNNH